MSISEHVLPQNPGPRRPSPLKRRGLAAFLSALVYSFGFLLIGPGLGSKGGLLIFLFPLLLLVPVLALWLVTYVVLLFVPYTTERLIQRLCVVGVVVGMALGAWIVLSAPYWQRSGAEMVRDFLSIVVSHVAYGAAVAWIALWLNNVRPSLRHNA